MGFQGGQGDWRHVWTFHGAWERRVPVPVEGLKITVLSKEDLIRNKKAVGRPRNPADVAELEETR